METQEILTYFINFVFLATIIFFLLDLGFFLLNSWQQLNPSTQPDFYASCSSTETVKTALAYQQVKDLLWDLDTQVAEAAT